MGDIPTLSVLAGSDSRQLPQAPLVPTPTDAEVAAAPAFPSTSVYGPEGKVIARVTLVRRERTGPVNVAILGQCYENEADLRSAALRLSRIQFPGTVVMVHWTSTCPVEPARQELFRSLAAFWRWGHLSEDVAKAGVAEVNRAHEEARVVGRNFQSVLAVIPVPLYDRPVHIFAHSMGAAVLHEALENGKLADYDVGRVVFMGGTAVANLSPRALGQVNGNVFNFFRADDWILGAVARTRHEPQVGMMPIPTPPEGKGGQIVNISVADIGHRHYWANGNKVLRSIDGMLAPQALGVRLGRTAIALRR